MHSLAWRTFPRSARRLQHCILPGTPWGAPRYWGFLVETTQRFVVLFVRGPRWGSRWGVQVVVTRATAYHLSFYSPPPRGGPPGYPGVSQGVSGHHPPGQPLLNWEEGGWHFGSRCPRGDPPSPLDGGVQGGGAPRETVGGSGGTQPPNAILGGNPWGNPLG